MGEVLDRKARERVREGMIGASQGRDHDVTEQGRASYWKPVDILGCAGCAHNLLRRNARALPAQLVAAARTANAAQHALAHERLKHRLEMARRQAVTLRQ